jgi:hypothetical protein
MPSKNVGGWAAAAVPSVKGTGMFTGASFFPLVPNLEPGKYIVRDLTKGPATEPLESLGVPHDVGRYNERRPAMYTTDLFGAADDPSSKRDIHMGIDIGGALSFTSFVSGAVTGAISICPVHSCVLRPGWIANPRFLRRCRAQCET